MPDIPNDVLPVIQMLMPGFLMTMAFYWFAEVPKPSHFERTLQALVATTIIAALMPHVRTGSLFIGERYFSLGEWTEASATSLSMFLGLFAGIVLAFLCNRDYIFAIARKLKITTRSSTSDSVHIFQKLGKSAVVLHLHDNRRLMCFYEAFPNDWQSDSFLVTKPSWVHGGVVTPCAGTGAIYVKATEVKWVEFLEDASNDRQERCPG